MYRPSSRQRPLIRSELGLHPSASARMEAGWPAQFAEKVLPLLLAVEDLFSSLYDPEVGRPNWGVARILGILILQDLHALHDQAALDAVSYDVRWHRALDIGIDGAYLSRRSLVAFRSMVVRADPSAERMRKVFDTLLNAELAELGLVVRAVRLDSTHTCSNIMTRGRLDLFMGALTVAVRAARRLAPTAHARIPTEILEACDADEDGSFGGTSAQEARSRLPKVAGWMILVRDLLAASPDFVLTEEFRVLARVISEHVRVGCVDDVVHATEGGGADGSPGTVPPESAPPGDLAGPAGASSASSGSRGEAMDGAAGTPVGASDEKAAAQTPPDPGAEVTSSGSVPPMVEVVKPAFPASTLQSAHDPDAGYSKKGVGYHVQIAETCDHEGVRLIVDYDVHSASVSDHGQAELSVARLEKGNLKPEKVYADSGYVSGASLMAFRDRGVELHGPVNGANLSPAMLTRTSWQRDAETGLLAVCPAGHPVTRHADRTVDGRKKLHAFVAKTNCSACPLAERCQARPIPKMREYSIEDTEAMRLRDEQYARQRTGQWREGYSIRSGVEATNSELKRAHGLRRLRVRRIHRVRMAVATKIIACNVKRMLASRK
jgi:hypothetical protein